MFKTSYRLDPVHSQSRFGRSAHHTFSARQIILILLFLVLLSIPSLPHAATVPDGFIETQIATGLESPTAMAFAPDGRLFVCLQGGQVRVIKNDVLLSDPFVTVSVDSTGERGLLGIAFDPDFATNNFVYIHYTVPTAPQHNRVSRFTASGDTAVPGSEAVILELDNLSTATNHNGGAIHFGADGKLYVAVGENGDGTNAQTLTNRLGKILRINADGTIPADNPFFNTATGANRSIYALGLRNPFTFAFQPGTNRLFINDVGLTAFEEINDGVAGANYGWPETEGPTADPSFRGPLFAYETRGGDPETCAISGGAFSNPAVNQFPAEFIGKYFFADFCAGWIRQLDPANPADAPLFVTDIPLPVDLQLGPDGSLYYLARGDDGLVARISSTVAPTSTLQFSAPNFSVNENATSAAITVTRSGAATGAVSVDYATGDGTAVATSDYTPASGTLNFGVGDATPKTFAVPVTNDASAEPDETVNLVLSNPVGGTLGTQSSAMLTIANDDSQGGGGGDGDRGGGGGGCVLKANAAFDPALPALMVLSAFYLLRRRVGKLVRKQAR